MVKLLLCLVCGVVLAAGMLQLRQQRRELAYRCGKLHSDINRLQVDLWNQQLQIATVTGPEAIEQTVGRYDLSLVRSAPTTAGSEDDDAE